MSKFNKGLWEHYGEETAYFAVITEDKFRKESLTETARQEFFAGGEEYIQTIWKEIESNFTANFEPQKAVDFGCGVGRLTIPLAKKCKKIIGVDISDKMLKEAQVNCEKFGIENASFVESDDTLSKLTEKVDFVHSFIVIQHIKPVIGEKIFSRLVEILNDGGVGALHIKYANPGRLASRLRYFVYREFPVIYRVRSLILGAKKEPLIPVYNYNLNNIFRILQEQNCHKCVVRFSDHGHLGVLIFFQKQKDITY
jgi:ubiquinone/menaquinone biosynthesis C-methylase UbiE